MQLICYCTEEELTTNWINDWIVHIINLMEDLEDFM
jgi:hypothetical protein